MATEDVQSIYMPSNFIEGAGDYLKGFLKEAFLPKSEANNVTIQYQLFTPDHPKDACLSDSSVDCLQPCRLSSNFRTKVILHGFQTKLQPGNLFELMKDALLETNPYNIIMVNWTLYSQKPYSQAVDNARIVGRKLAVLLSCLVKKSRRLRPDGLHLIGHSLGAHAAGYAGSLLSNQAQIGRITGLDPAGPYFEIPKLLGNHRLSHEDAQFVDVIHTSDFFSFGYGLDEAIGHMDFYPNGGHTQPTCSMGSDYYMAENDIETITSSDQMSACNHGAANNYFLESIRNKNDCRFVATLCNSYSEFQKQRCPPETAEMGLRSARNPNLPVPSRFYLTTSDKRPYC